MSARFGRETWSLVVPAGWRAWHDEECATLAAVNEIGALQISASFKDGQVLDSDLADFASEHLQAGAIPREVRAGDFVGIEITLSDGTNFWRHWYLRNAEQMLYITYNCDHGSRGVEDAAVNEAVASLSASGSHVA